MLMPFPKPVASMMVVALPAPMSDSVLLMVTSSLYVPAATWIVSPDAAALTAAEMLVWQPEAPVGFTHSVADKAGCHAPASTSTQIAIPVVTGTDPVKLLDILLLMLL